MVKLNSNTAKKQYIRVGKNINNSGRICGKIYNMAKFEASYKTKRGLICRYDVIK